MIVFRYFDFVTVFIFQMIRSAATLFGFVPIDRIWVHTTIVCQTNKPQQHCVVQQHLPNGVAVSVKSWSINWPQATTMTVPACSCWPSSGWIVRDTTLASGNGSPEADTFGADNLSENRGGINLKRTTTMLTRGRDVLEKNAIFHDRQPVECWHRGTPIWILYVVAQPVSPAVLTGLAGDSRHTWRTHVPYKCLGRVNLGQEFVHVVGA